MGPTLASAHVSPPENNGQDRVLFLVALSIPIAMAAALVAQGLTHLIGFFTNLSFYGRLSSAFISPAANNLGVWVIAVPVCGGIIVGLMARYGAKAIRGHGIPEAMEQVLFNESRVAPKLTFLKPLSSAIAIGTGGPFGAEGPIIATGGAIGSLVGQLLKTNADERKILLAAGAAAGMSATFGSPLSALLLAIELLLFEYRTRSFVPVAFASVIAAGIRMAFLGSAPIFGMQPLPPPGGLAIVGYIVLGAIVGVTSVWATRTIYWIEDAFEKLPVHWMWWPAIGGLAVGIVGYFAPLSMGVGYDNIDNILDGSLIGKALIVLLVLKFVSWSISLGSGTSGGTLAPLFTFGGAIGSLLGAAAARFAPAMGMDHRTAALVGMAAMFAGASHALLASVVFAFETTLQPFGLLPLLGGCSTAYIISKLMMRHSIMTEKIARRGLRLDADYSADPLARMLVREAATPDVVYLRDSQAAGEVAIWLGSGKPGSTHTGFPVLNGNQNVIGVLTRRDITSPGVDPAALLGTLIRRPPVVVEEASSVREAIETMVMEGVGRLPVVSCEDGVRLTGIVTRSDLLGMYGKSLHESHHFDRTIRLGAAANDAAKGNPSGGGYEPVCAD
ncbi:MAG: chloride channel protein [Bryobacterales bacterium]|nr:chloride channel protein [Bryobacterales bacterium]